MKKSLIALAVLTSIAASASAQSNITIYGVADAGLAYSKDGSGNNYSSMISGGQSGSRIGFRGAEDLGGGTQAIFTLEQGYTINNGAQAQSLLFGRQAFVGLNNSQWGAAKFGRQYTPMRTALESINPFEYGLAGNIVNIFNTIPERTDNTVNYQTPKISGFSGQAAYSFGQNTVQDQGQQKGVSANYANGPVYVALAYHKYDTISGAAATAETGNRHATMLGGVYDFGILKAHAAYSINKGETLAGVDNLDSRDLMVGISVPVGGSGKFLASYMKKKNELIANADSKMFSLGYTYDLSKRTNLYTSYAKINNDANASLSINNATGTVVADADPSTFNVGIRHKF